MSKNMENTNASSQFKKLNRLQWNKIERNYEDPITKAVLNTMQKLGSSSNETIDITSDVKICGNEIYLNIRKLLLDNGLIDIITYNDIIKTEIPIKPKNKKNKKNKTKLSKDEMIATNTIKHVSKNIEEVIKTFSYKKYNVSYGFRSPYAEIRLITFMYAIKFLSTSPINLPNCYELILGIKKTLSNIHLLKNVSIQSIQDLTLMYNKFVSYSEFTYATMFERFPRLCIMTVYDTVFTNMSIKPYNSQKELMDHIKNNINTPGIYCYKAMIGTGKTTFAIALSEFVNNKRIIEKANGNKSKLQLLFACCVEPVRHQVCQMAYNQQIPFGIGVIDSKGSHKIINNFSCKNDDDRILIVSDLETSIELLKQSPEYILFIDEPTSGADMKNTKDTKDNSATKAVAKLMSVCPKTTILCSATLPEPEEIKEIINDFKTRHTNACDPISVYSKESLIGCELINFDGSTILPHNYTKTTDQLKIIINNLKTKPFIDRLYTAPIVYKLQQRLTEYGIKGINLENYFADIELLSQTNIQKAAIILLEILLQTNDNNLIEKICVPFGKIIVEEKMGPEQEPEQEDNEEDSGFAWEKEETPPVQDNTIKQYNLDNIFTSESHRYLGGCLVTVKNPYTFAFEKSKYLRENCESANKIIGKYNTLIEKFNQSLEKLEYIKNDEERTKKQQELQNSFKPEFTFPSHFRINTLNHIRKFAKDSSRNINQNSLRYNFNLETLPLDLNVEDWVMLLLFSGVGIYDPTNKLLDQKYLDLILDMTAEGKLSFLISDDSICYGANYPFSHVVIEDEIAENRSIGTIFQLLGRAGRVGQSWVAYGHIGDKISERIMNYIKGYDLEGTSIEAANLNRCFNSVKEENIKKSNIIKLSDVTKAVKVEKIKNEPINIIEISKVSVEKNEIVDSWEQLV